MDSYIIQWDLLCHEHVLMLKLSDVAAGAPPGWSQAHLVLSLPGWNQPFLRRALVTLSGKWYLEISSRGQWEAAGFCLRSPWPGGETPATAGPRGGVK